MRDEGGDDEDDTAEDDKDEVYREVFDVVLEGLGDDAKETRRRDGLTERQATAGKHDDCPEEVVKVFLC